jgi:hypothetical protein
MERSSQARVNVSENCYKCSISISPTARGRGRPRTQDVRATPHAGGDARAPRTCVLRRTRAGTPAPPGRACYATRGRGRPRPQDVRGSVMLPHDLKAHSSPARTLSHFSHQDAPHPPLLPLWVERGGI